MILQDGEEIFSSCKRCKLSIPRGSYCDDCAEIKSLLITVRNVCSNSGDYNAVALRRHLMEFKAGLERIMGEG